MLDEWFTRTSTRRGLLAGSGHQRIGESVLLERFSSLRIDCKFSGGVQRPIGSLIPAETRSYCSFRPSMCDMTNVQSRIRGSDMLVESYVPLDEILQCTDLVRTQKSLVEGRITENRIRASFFRTDNTCESELFGPLGESSSGCWRFLVSANPPLR